ncbi:MFS transporter [Niveispirillum sp. KHB5.9]|uniref:MFS transporter n=1 Tax=Niveispirillum sp. KHB5.9 TaxID=3400269 RepID=UPI003A85C834
MDLGEGKRRGRALIAAYAAGSLGTGVLSTVPAVLLLYYCTQTLGLAPGLIGLALLLAKGWAIVWDPLVGLWADRTGRRRTFLLVGAVGASACFAALFQAPMAGAFVWVAGFYLALTCFNGLFAVPYVGMPALMEADAGRRSRLVAARMVFSLSGVLAGAALAPTLVAWFGGDRPGYGAMALAMGGFCLLAMLLPLLGLGGIAASGGGGAASLAGSLLQAWASRRFRALAIAYLLQMAAASGSTAALPYLAARLSGQGEAAIGVAMGVMLGSTVLATPIWAVVGRRVGEGRAALAGAGLYALLLVLLGLAGLLGLGWGLMLGLLSLCGVAFAALQVLPFTLLAGLTRAEGGSAVGVFTGVWTAVEKLGLAAGPMLLGLTLQMAGEAQVTGAGLFMLLVPPVLLAGSMVFIRRC